MVAKWDETSEKCPYGHLKVDCQIRRTRPDGKTNNECKINGREKRRALERSRRQPAFKVIFGPGKIQERTNGKPRYVGHYTLICEHTVVYIREYVNVREPLWCSRCEDLKHIHHVDATKLGERGFTVYPIGYEVPPYRGSRFLEVS